MPVAKTNRRRRERRRERQSRGAQFAVAGIRDVTVRQPEIAASRKRASSRRAGNRDQALTGYIHGVEVVADSGAAAAGAQREVDDTVVKRGFYSNAGMQRQHREKRGRDRDGRALDERTGIRGPGRAQADAGQSGAEGKAGALTGTGNLEAHR